MDKPEFLSFLKHLIFQIKLTIMRTSILFVYSIFFLFPFHGTAQIAELSERRLMEPTGWWWLTGVTAEQISQKTDEGFRIIDLEIESASPLRFSTAMVKNEGVHRKSWWWYYGLTSDQVKEKIQQHNARLIDLEVYYVNNSPRYALVMVSNTGTERKSWWYYSRLTFEELQQKLAEKRGRLLDLDTYIRGSNRFFSAVMVPNTGDEAKSWWYYTNMSAEEVSDKLRQHQARLTDVEVRSNSNGNITFSVVMERLSGETWWWYYGKTMSEVSELTNQHGARIIDIEPYTNQNDQKRFVVIMLRNTNDLTHHMRSYLAEKRKGGAYGFYLKRVDGNVLASLQEDKPFYPASTIKVLEHVHAMCAIQDGTTTLATPMRKYENDSQSCADNHTGHTAVIFTMEIILRTMMEASDNQSTNALQEFFGNGNAEQGRAEMNNTAHRILGMSDETQLNHKFGCGGPSNNPANSLTLADLGRLYERSSTGLLNEANTRTFDNLMLNMGQLNPIIDEEASRLGISAANVRLFKNQLESRAKAGSVSRDGLFYRSIGGWVELPVQSGTSRQYVFGLFIDKAEELDSDQNMVAKAGAELLRQPINQALATYR